MAKKRSSKSRFDVAQWLGWLKSPLMQQTLAVLLILLSLLTFIGLLDLASGLLLDWWVGLLQLLFGWGVVPVSALIAITGILILLHHLDRPIAWRWRPIVGLELVFFSLLSLTHLVAGRADPWGLVVNGWGGGLVGWAIARVLNQYVGFLPTIFLLLVTLALGMALTLDVTLKDVQAWLRQLRSRPQPQVRSRRRREAGAPRSRAPRTAAPPRQEVRPSTPTPAPRPEPKPAPERPIPSPSPPSPSPSTPAPQKAKPVPLASMAMDEELELPPLDILEEAEAIGLSDQELREKSRIIVETLRQFGLPVQVVEVRRGPTVTQFGVAPGYTERGERVKKVRVSQITSLADDLALALAAPALRVEAPVPGRSVVGIEVPNEEISLVSLRSVMESERFERMDAPLAVALGQDIAGEPIVANLGTMPHLLIAGTTGSGKSVAIKTLATCLMMNNRPDELRMVMIDPKMVELIRFNGLPHLLGSTEYEFDRVTRVLRWVAYEMDQRYKKFAALGARHLDDYNQRVRRNSPEEYMPRIVVFIDELADLMMTAPDQTERTICRIAQMARATGIHLVVATQRPSVDVVTGLIKANFPARISFATASQVDSRVILDMPGAETLLGKGDMLYLASDAGHPVRVQGCFVSEDEVVRVVDFWKDQVPSWVTQAPWEPLMPGSSEGEELLPGEERDEMLDEAIKLVQRRKTISASRLQRKLRIGYPRAARLMEQLEDLGLVGPQQAAGRPRRVIGGEK